MVIPNFYKEVKLGQRFRFGENWRKYLKTLSNQKVKIAEDSLLQMLDMKDLKEHKFLDIGSGSGLFSLAATNLGAEVYSIDFDPDSIACNEYLREKYYSNSNWQIKEASVLDKEFLRTIGEFDIVYSWGVLHHTGNLKLALENVLIPLKVGGKLFISIYNDQGIKSVIWKKIKKLYNLNFALRIILGFIFISYYVIRLALKDIINFHNPFVRYKNYIQNRGMSMWIDWIDWLGGYPFEVARPQQIIDFFTKNCLSLIKSTTTKSGGTNQFVFVRKK